MSLTTSKRMTAEIPPSLGGVLLKVKCAIEIENREDLWYNKISTNWNLKTTIS